MSESDRDPLYMETTAATLRSNLSDPERLMALLARKLSASLPRQTKVVRKRRLFGGGVTIRQIALDLGEYRYSITNEPDTLPAASKAHIVRGITVKTETMETQSWIDDLCAELARQAERSERAREALQKFILG